MFLKISGGNCPGYPPVAGLADTVRARPIRNQQ